jgi:hypothetical protein
MGANTIIIKSAYQPDYPVCQVPPAYISDTKSKIDRAHARGLLVCCEAYIVPAWAREGAALLKQALRDGANSVLLNAESEWESTNQQPAINFLAEFNRAGPLHLCSDIRGNRLAAPYHQAFWSALTGAHPMCYHRAFRPGNPFGALQQCFDETLGALANAKAVLPKAVPIYPVVQGYDGCDYEETLGAVILSHLYGCPGSSVYVSHDLNKRAELGVRDGWKIVEQLLAPPTGLTAVQRGEVIGAITTAVTTALQSTLMKY